MGDARPAAAVAQVALARDATAHGVVERMRRPGLEPVWAELVERWASAGDRPVVAVQLRDLDAEARRALADLLGLDRLPGARHRVRVDRVAAALAVDEAMLRKAVAELLGPINDRVARRRQQAEHRAGLWTWLADECSARGLDGWCARVRIAGVPDGDVDAHRRLLGMVLGAVDRLPAGGMPLARFAADVVGDPHGLDPDTRIATLLLDAVACRLGRPAAASAEDARRLWASVGVVADELSSVVLVHGIAPRADHPLAVFLRASCDTGEPAVLTLAQLQRWPLLVDATETVRVVENPSVVASAAARGLRSAMVCTAGWPNVAVTTLLRQLVGTGARLLAHADFDAAGLRIVQHLVERFDVTPWAMTADRYRRHVPASSVRLDAPLPATPWDPALADAMTAERVAVHEEHMIDDLLDP